MEQYCMLICRSKFISNDKKVWVDFGENESLLKRFDQNVMQETRKVSTVDNIVDALNYMSYLGWEMVHITPFITDTDGGTYDTFRYLMKRAIP
jgi:hypothetical protein